MSQNPGYTPPPIPQSGDPAQASTVRRHHTIASSSGRMGTRIVERRDSEEAAAEEDETDDQWTGGAAMSSEKQASLQRNLSLPSKYHRPTRDQPSMQTGTLTPSKSIGGLSSLDAGPEDEEWSGVAATMYDEDEASNMLASSCFDHIPKLFTDQIATSQTHPENLYQVSPPAAPGAVRRHVSMTDGQRTRKEPGLGRHPTMSGKPPMRSNTMNATTEAVDDEHTAAYEDAEEDLTSYPPESAYGGIQQSPWDQSTPNDQPWRADQQQANIEDVMNNLSNLDIQRQGPNYARGGPRFDPGAPGGYPDYAQQLQQRNIMNQSQRMVVNTEVQAPSGPVSASAYVPAPGHNVYHSNRESMGSGDDHHRTASGSEWDRKGPMLKGRGSNPNIGQGYQNQYGGGGGGGFGNMPPPPPIPAQYLNQAQAAGRLGGGNMPLGMGGYGPTGGAGQAFGGGLMGQPQGQPGLQQQPPALDPAAILSSPIDVPSMIAQKGYNPANFDTRPPFARYFVIKSYTEDDVHKSLKYEIWSSTDPGNKRLDKAFKECAGRGPIYLFFSVNASGHFCGMAEMLTSVDYTRSSTVWASDKWKGVFKVRWIFVRDIPNAVLRNIRLNNTQERKPVTNSRDTQELLPEAGHEMLRIFFTHPAKTSLLQDFAFYELQSLQKQQQATMPSIPPAGSPPPPMHGLPGGQGGQHTYGMAYNPQQSPQSPPQVMGNAFNHLNMQNSGSSHYVGPIGMGIGQQVAQSVLRGSSPGPIGSGFPGAGGNGGYQGMSANSGPGGMSANAGPTGNGSF